MKTPVPKVILTSLFLFLTCMVSIAESDDKKSLSHEDYAAWNNIGSMVLSPDGKWLAYERSPQKGDGCLVLFDLETLTSKEFPRGYDPVFSKGLGFVAFRIKPPENLVRQAKVDKKKTDEMPKDSLAILNLNSMAFEKSPNLLTFTIPQEPSDWIAYNIEVIVEPENNHENLIDTLLIEEFKETRDTIAPEKKKDKKRLQQKKLFVYNPIEGYLETIDNVEGHVFAPSGVLVAGVVEKNQGDSIKFNRVQAFNTKTQQSFPVGEFIEGEIKQLNICFEGKRLAWLHSPDTTKTKKHDLWLWQEKDTHPTMAITSSTVGMPVGFSPGEHFKPYFSKNGKRLFLGTAPTPLEEPSDTLLAEEKYSLDIWHWNDPVIQPVQISTLDNERKKAFMAVYHINEKKLVQLADTVMQTITLDEDSNLDLALGLSSAPYLKFIDYNSGMFNDVFVVEIKSGNRILILEKHRGRVNLSPGGNFLVWYDSILKHWMSYNMKTGQTKNITKDITVPLHNELHDIPAAASAHGTGGWFEKDKYVVVYDRYDVWKVDPTGRQKPQNITGGTGRESGITFRIENLDRQTPFFSLGEKLILRAFNQENKQSGYYALDDSGFFPLVMKDASLGHLQKAQNTGRFVWREGTFAQFNDIWTTSTDFENPSRVSNANPQQQDYHWGSVELVRWIDFDNEPKQGLLYLPDDLDTEKKYPMLVYFYERSSNGLHNHSIPSPSRSTINRPYCTSNGYIVFIPDITYKDGFPGESAYNSVVSGTNAMVDRYAFIDRNNIGLQGQSWGGYQIAYLVTRTNMFKAAMAGAPVSNMVSAYGGIRWESGRSRQFQYEEAQSRIGGTLWEKPLRYIENSPVFFADKIETPLLIMHNDDDGAVPWYQGIELFMAMRRLNKPVWMLVYNKEKHNLAKWPNRMDLSMRMYQFFDHYLKGEPAPVWLKQGISATQKGKTHGYELINNQ